MRVLVAGAGALGSTIALCLARAGVQVTLVDPAPSGANASAVAAGMLAPAFETLFDAAALDFDRLRRARDLWPAFADSIGLELDRSGAMAVGSPEELDAWADGLRNRGIPAVRLSPIAAREKFSWLAAGLAGLWTPEDWRLEPRAALAALRRAAVGKGVVVVKAGLADFDQGQAVFDDRPPIAADRLVIATGASRALVGLAPELATLIPIKGHILRAPGLALTGPVVRLEGGYICPAPGGALIGATMEVGRDDDIVDPEAVAALRRMAARVLPGAQTASVIAATGVRAATADGEPLSGPSSRPGVWIAAGARRNGWLLAPRIGESLARSILADSGPDVLT